MTDGKRGRRNNVRRENVKHEEPRMGLGDSLGN